MKKIIKFADILLSAVCFIIFTLIILGTIYIPENVIFYDGNTAAEFLSVFKIKEENADIITVSTVNDTGGKADVSLFGIIPVGKVNAEKHERTYVRVGGDVIGIRLYTEGLLVVGMEDVASKDGSYCPGKDSGVEIGDIITKINDKTVHSVSDFSNVIEGCGGDFVNLEIKRENEIYLCVMKPVYSDSEGKYRCGLWLRDSTAGIGTLTFADVNTGMFASLGHAICDSDTQAILPVGEGDILGAEINGCTPGEKGVTGQIKGSFTDEVLGTLIENNEFGVYGTFSDVSVISGEEYPVASQSEIKPGKAQIISTVDGGGKDYYDIEIEKITYSNDKTSRSMVIKVTDEELLGVTGGIIQGMSGSPIIQNGMLVGAVTHVFLNDPTRGYGIFAETMLSEEYRLRQIE